MGIARVRARLAEAARQQQSPTRDYVQSDQWRYDSEFTDYDAVPEGAKWATGHAMDLEAKAVRMGWMPFFPHLKESSLEVALEAEAAGATDVKAVAAHVAGRLKSKDLELQFRRAPHARHRRQGEDGGSRQGDRGCRLARI